MKKLMIAAATAAMVGGAFADAQVWEMTLTTKTTESKIGTVKSACEACDGATSYRKQATVKLAGLFWGCTCDEMVGLTGPVSENEGVFFWNASKKAAFYDQDAGQYAEIDFAWNLLNRIGNKAADCEGVWTLNVGNFALYGAGFGKVAGCDDAAYIKSMNGNFAGTYIAGNGCKRCEEASGSAWALCDCGEADELTAAYGTWSLKYNASATKKFADSSDWSWYKFPGDTLEAIEELITGKPAPTPTPADLVKKQYADAKKAYDDAKAAFDAAVAEKKIADKGTGAEYDEWAEGVAADAVAKYKSLKKALDKATTAFNDATKTGAELATAWTTAGAGTQMNAYTNAAAAYGAAQYTLSTNTVESKVADLTKAVTAAKNALTLKKTDLEDTIDGTAAKALKADLMAVIDPIATAMTDMYVEFGKEPAGEAAVKTDAAAARTAELNKMMNSKYEPIDDTKTELGKLETKVSTAEMACILAGVICE